MGFLRDVAKHEWLEKSKGGMLGAGTWMGQEKKRFQMTLEDEMVPGGDGSYLVRACSACVSCFGSLLSKTQLG